MKIEKLTENKIRVIVQSCDLKDSSFDIHTIMSTTLENQNFFLDMLSKAEKEVGFNTEGCKLLIEAYSSSEDFLVFTITKYNLQKISSEKPSKKFIAKRKSINFESENAIYKFNNFDNFLDFCSTIKIFKNFNIHKFCKSSKLFLYKHSLYLSLSKINIKSIYINKFYYTLSEFASPVKNPEIFESKLLEYGQILVKKDAIK